MTENLPLAGSGETKDALALFDQLMNGPMQARIPSVMSATLAMRPDIYAAVMAAGKPILFDGALPVSVKQMIIMILAEQRNCRFCSDAHRLMLDAMGIDQLLIESCLDDPERKLVPPMYRQIIQFALQAAKNPNGVDDEQFECLRDCGLNEEEILEAAMVASFANFLVTWSGVSVDLGD